MHENLNCGFNRVLRVVKASSTTTGTNTLYFPADPLLDGRAQGTNDFFESYVDSGSRCSPAYSPFVADSIASIAGLWLLKCPQTEIILRGLSILVDQGVWPSQVTVVRFSSPVP